MMVRNMTEDDVKEVAAIEAASFSQPWSEKGFFDALAMRDTLFLVAEEQSAGEQFATKKLAGYIGMYVSFDEGEITNVAVREELRGGGIGKWLVMAMQECAKERGVTTILLEVRQSNAPAIGAYEACGFKKIGVRKGFYNFPKEDADLMQWQYNK